ncbi:NADH-plastoquinone oxidoreductase subunit 7, partial (chloroplast), partial [Olea europaea subsp. europaea]
IFREQELIYDLFEVAICMRMMHNYFRTGGIDVDLPHEYLFISILLSYSVISFGYYLILADLGIGFSMDRYFKSCSHYVRIN